MAKKIQLNKALLRTELKTCKRFHPEIRAFPDTNQPSLTACWEQRGAILIPFTDGELRSERAQTTCPRSPGETAADSGLRLECCLLVPFLTPTNRKTLWPSTRPCRGEKTEALTSLCWNQDAPRGTPRVGSNGPRLISFPYFLLLQNSSLLPSLHSL